jgi:hypothetical protein
MLLVFVLVNQSSAHYFSRLRAKTKLLKLILSQFRNPTENKDKQKRPSAGLITNPLFSN